MQVHATDLSRRCHNLKHRSLCSCQIGGVCKVSCPFFIAQPSYPCSYLTWFSDCVQKMLLISVSNTSGEALGSEFAARFADTSVAHFVDATGSAAASTCARRRLSTCPQSHFHGLAVASVVPSNKLVGGFSMFFLGKGHTKSF